MENWQYQSGGRGRGRKMGGQRSVASQGIRTVPASLPHSLRTHSKPRQWPQDDEDMQDESGHGQAGISAGPCLAWNLSCQRAPPFSDGMPARPALDRSQAGTGTPLPSWLGHCDDGHGHGSTFQQASAPPRARVRISSARGRRQWRHGRGQRGGCTCKLGYPPEKGQARTDGGEGGPDCQKARMAL